MAREVGPVAYETGATLYFLTYNLTRGDNSYGEIRDVDNDNWESYNVSNYLTFDTLMSEDEDSGIFWGDLPAGLSLETGTYSIIVKESGSESSDLEAYNTNISVATIGDGILGASGFTETIPATGTTAWESASISSKLDAIAACVGVHKLERVSTALTGYNSNLDAVLAWTLDDGSNPTDKERTTVS